MQVRWFVLSLLALILTFVAITLIALEGREVVVLQTAGADGTVHRTRTWVADEDGAAWIEAANPDRPFLQDLQRNPTLTIERSGRQQQCRATVAANPDGHRRIRRLLAVKYGWADWWIGQLTDTSDSLAVRLDCL